MDYEQIEYRRDGAVAWITLNRPEKLNAWTPRMSREQWHAIERANDDRAVGAIVMTGAGRGFCAGADISGFAEQQASTRSGSAPDEALTTPGDWVELCRRSKPLVAAVNGAAVGVGMTMILPFDVIVASDRAKFGMFFIRMGLVPELASTHFLVQRVGFARASELCLTGRAVPATELAGSGLVNAVVPADELAARAGTIAAEIAANPDPQLRMIKQLLTENGADTDLSAVSKREMESLRRCYQSPEHAEAIRAFGEKRAPRFR